MAIVINSTTGEIDLDATTPDIYVVTYTVEGVSSTQEVTVNALDNAAFTYSASSYAPTDADPTPTITGLTGGTFSAGSGLVFVDSGTNTGSSTGEIDLSASTIASYTITYNTTSSGSSVCPNTSTQTVEIALAGISNVYSMDFDGVNDYINLGSSSILAPGVGSFTFSAWINPTTWGSGYHWIWGTPTSGGMLIGKLDNGNFGLRASNVGNFVETATLPALSTWTHICITRDSSNTLTLFYNGVQETVDLNMTQNFSSGTTYIGSESVSHFNGKIDEVAIWNTALTSSQVAQIYNETSTGRTSDLSTISGSNLKYWNRMGD